MLACILLVACTELPPLEGRNPSTAVPATATADTRLGHAATPLVREHRGESGIVPLPDGREALGARLVLANAAERTLDVQYYIWQQDLSGTMLFDALYRAAERGVRVRLLLDDNNTDGLDPIIATLDEHPRIQVRLFNPFMHRDSRWLGYLTDFARLNRRMHNKSFTADNQATIVGGRNVGDEYFGAGGGMLYTDLDVLAIGPVVDSVSRDFDRYWSSDSAYPAGRIVSGVDPIDLAALAQARDGSNARAYARSVAESSLVQALLEGDLEFEWAETRMVSDDPAKALGEAERADLLTERIREAFGPPTRELLLVSAYFVPAEAGEKWLTGLEERGVEVTVLTNSLEATDVAPVHAGYAKRRVPLLKGGVALYEMKREAAPGTARDRGLTGDSASSLHAKTFAIDRNRIFVGSFNFDPRSARLNTEMGFVIESPELARHMAGLLERRMPTRAYAVRLGPDGELRWVEQQDGQQDGQQSVHEEEPGSSALLRVAIAVMAALPIEWLL